MQKSSLAKLIKAICGISADNRRLNFCCRSSNCRWVLTVPAGRVQVEIVYSDIESSANCAFDSLEIYDGKLIFLPLKYHYDDMFFSFNTVLFFEGSTIVQ